MKLEEARSLGIVNGIGGAGGFNFSTFIKNNIQQFKEYIPEQGILLFGKIEMLANCHDVAYYNGNTLLDKIKADYLFCLGVMRKLWWTSFYKRLFVFSFLFIILLINGNKYFNWGEKKYITLEI